MEIVYLNLYKSILSQLLFNGFHEYFPEAFEKYTRFSKFNLLYSNSYVRINRETVCS